MYITVKICLKLLFLTFISISVVEGRKLKIVGGQPIDIKTVPYQIVYLSNGDFVCSGALITRSHIATAAHCIANYQNKVTVRMGSSFRNRNGIIVNIEKFVSHPNYNPNTYDYDYGLMKLSTPVKYSRFIQPARLPHENSELLPGTECSISGWGLRSYYDIEEPPVELHAAKINIVDFQNCSTNYTRISQYLTDRMICGGTIDASRDACLGDSGGPLVCNGTFYGVISFGYGCATKDFPGIYSKISMVLPWIRKTLQVL